MNYKLLSIIALLSVLAVHNVAAMEKEKPVVNPLDKISQLTDFLNEGYDENKYYGSDSYEAKMSLPIFQAIVAKAGADQHSRTEDSYVVVSDGSFDMEGNGLSVGQVVTSLAIAKRRNPTDIYTNNNLSKAEKELAENGLKAWVITFEQSEILRTIKNKMNTLVNVHEIWGDKAVRDGFVATFNILNVIYKTDGITIKGCLLDDALQEAFKESNS